MWTVSGKVPTNLSQKHVHKSHSVEVNRSQSSLPLERPSVVRHGKQETGQDKSKTKTATKLDAVHSSQHQAADRIEINLTAAALLDFLRNSQTRARTCSVRSCFELLDTPVIPDPFFHAIFCRRQGRSKEGFSVFGLFDQTKSASGRRCLKEWMLKPLHDIAAISARQVRIGLQQAVLYGTLQAR